MYKNHGLIWSKKSVKRKVNLMASKTLYLLLDIILPLKIRIFITRIALFVIRIIP